MEVPDTSFTDPACMPAMTVFRSKSEAKDAGMAGSLPNSIDFDVQMVAQDGACEGECILLVIQPTTSGVSNPTTGESHSAPVPQQEWLEVQVVLPDPCCIGPMPSEAFFEACQAVRYGVLAILPDSDVPVCFTYRPELCIAM